MNEKIQNQSLPKLTLKVSGKKEIKIPEDLFGKKTIFYFYPKDDTPGCTKQACSYRDHIQEFQSKDVQVYGVSLDGLDSHENFIQKFSLNFPLISDSEKELSNFFGVLGEKEWNGKKYMGLSRDSFLINEEGKVEKIWRNVNPLSTVEEILKEFN